MAEGAAKAKDPRIIDGNAIAAKIRAEISAEVAQLKASGRKVPGVGVVLVGDRTDSATYVKMKQQACEQVGMSFSLKKCSATATEAELLALVHELNEDQDIHGILVQLPLPPHINEKKILDAVDRRKDVDGFNPTNIGELAMKGYDPFFVPCTPKGCMEMLLRENIPIAGKHAVVLGRSNIVGTPMALLLLKQNATVTICHSRTQNLPDMLRQADILVAAIGSGLFVKKEWVKPGCVIIDVGMNSIEDASRPKGYRLVGDVDKEAYAVASRYTPVPGGVGPMTVAMLLQNTLNAAKKWYELKPSKSKLTKSTQKQSDSNDDKKKEKESKSSESGPNVVSRWWEQQKTTLLSAPLIPQFRAFQSPNSQIRAMAPRQLLQRSTPTQFSFKTLLQTLQLNRPLQARHQRNLQSPQRVSNNINININMASHKRVRRPVLL